MIRIDVKIQSCRFNKLQVVVCLDGRPGSPSTMTCTEEGILPGPGEPGASFERALTEVEAARIRKAMLGVKVLAVPGFVVGLDGHTVFLEIENGFNSACYKWWVSAPAGWEPLDGLVQTILGVADVPEVLERVYAGI